MCKRSQPMPQCFWCGIKAARVLPVDSPDGLAPAVYCSLRCAAAAALHDDALNGLYWCRRCWDWHYQTDKAYGCPTVLTPSAEDVS